MGVLATPPRPLDGTPLVDIGLPAAALRVARRLGWGTVGELAAVPPAVLRALGVGPSSLAQTRAALAALGIAPAAWEPSTESLRKRRSGRRKRSGPPPTWERLRLAIPTATHPRPLATLTNLAGRPLLPGAVRAFGRHGIHTIGDLVSQAPEALLALVSRSSLTRLAAALRDLDASVRPNEVRGTAEAKHKGPPSLNW
jgi:hypothetical protein